MSLSCQEQDNRVYRTLSQLPFGLECTLKSGTPTQLSFGLECTLKSGTPTQFFHLVFNALSTTQYSFWSVQYTYSTCRMEDMDIGHYSPIPFLGSIVSLKNQSHLTSF